MLRVRVSEAEMDLLAKRCQLFNMSSPDFIRRAIASYNPKVTQQLLDSFVDFLAVKQEAAPPTSALPPIPPDGDGPHIDFSPTPSKILPKNHPVATLTVSSSEDDLLVDMSQEFAEIIPNGQKMATFEIAHYLLGRIRAGSSGENLYTSFVNRLYGDRKLVPPDRITSIEEVLNQCVQIVRTA